MYEKYKQCLSRLCFFLGKIQTMTNIAEEKELSASYLYHVIIELGRAKKEFLLAKEAVGLAGGLSFMEDNKFHGFEIKRGRFVGDTDNVCAITNPWIADFSPENCYLYEVAHLVQYLAFPELTFCKEMLAEEVTEEVMAGNKTVSVPSTVVTILEPETVQQNSQEEKTAANKKKIPNIFRNISRRFWKEGGNRCVISTR